MLPPPPVLGSGSGSGSGSGLGSVPPPVLVFEPPPVYWPVVTVPSALMVVWVPFSATMIITVPSPARALRVMVSGQGPVR